MSALSQDEIIPAEPLTDVVPEKPESTGYAAETFLGTPSDESTPAPHSGAQLLGECASRMPEEPLKMFGTLTMRKAYGVELKKFAFIVSIHWGAQPPTATYEILTTDGEAVETVTAVRHDDGHLEMSRFSGPEKTPRETPVLNSAVLGTDITWLDITMGYVWWRNPTLNGTGKIKGRLCDILEVEPPSPMMGCAKARLWIDREQKMVMQAAQVDEKGRETRKMWVRAVQKIDNRWVLRDVEVETMGSGHRTRLHIDDVKSAE